MEESIMNFIVGPTKSGKTTFCNFLSGNPLSITRNMFNFEIQVSDSLPKSNQIGNRAVSGTRTPSYFGDFCDFPGFYDTRGEEANLNTLIDFYYEVQKFSRVRLIFVVEESYVCSANGSLFLNLLTDFIDLFDLTEENAQGIAILVTKTSEEFCRYAPEYFNELYHEDFNFIIGCVKNRRIMVLPFEKPKMINEKYQLIEENKTIFYERLNGLNYLNTQKLKEKIYTKLKNKLVSMRENYKNYSNIVFTSKIKENLNNSRESQYKSDFMLCIDKNDKFTQDYFLIDAQIIIVLPEESKVLVEVKGKNPVINFSANIKKVINGENLIISTKNSSKKLAFPDPLSKNFSMDWMFYRVESICVNSLWTEYASHNNKFIDLIVYFNPEFGKVYANPDFNIKTITIDLRLKLFINECMRTKKGAMKKFLSLRMCKNVEEYLELSKKSNINEKIKTGLEEYVIKVPSIFQLLMEQKYLAKFSGVRSEIDDLLKIKRILLENYLELLTGFNSGKSEITYTDELIEAYKLFQKFCKGSFDVNPENISRKNSKLVDSLSKFLNSNLESGSLLDFYSFYDTLATSEQKNELFKYKISGDISCYVNYQSLINRNITLGITFEEFKATYANLANGILIGGGITIGVGTARYFILRSSTSIAVRAGLGASTALAAILGAALIVGDIGVNIVCALAKSGYYDGEMVLDPKFYRLDI